MNFANALIQWGQVTGNTAVRDAGIFIYTTQAQAIQQYWFDVDGTTFPAGWQHSAVGMVWGDGGSYATWFSPDPEKIQGINMLPITGGHLYLGYRPDYVKKNYQEIVASSGGAPRVWQDVIWSSWPPAIRTPRWPLPGEQFVRAGGGGDRGAHLPLDPQPRRARAGRHLGDRRQSAGRDVRQERRAHVCRGQCDGDSRSP